MDPNWIMAIIAISAIFFPAIVSIIDNIFKYKTRQLELNYPEKRKVLTNFVIEAINIFKESSYVEVSDYDIAKNNLYMYFNNVPDELIKNMENYNDGKITSRYTENLALIVKELSKQINK